MNPLRRKISSMTDEEKGKFYRSVFSGEAGEFVLEDLKMRNWFYEPVFTGEPYLAAFRDGARSMILTIESLCEVKGLDETQKQGET